MSLRPKKRSSAKRSFKRDMNKWLMQSHKEGRLDTYSTPRVIAMKYNLSPVESEEAYYAWLRKKGYKQLNTYRKQEPIDAKCPKCDRKLSTSMDYHQLYCPEHKFLDAVECGIVPTRPSERIHVKQNKRTKPWTKNNRNKWTWNEDPEFSVEIYKYDTERYYLVDVWWKSHSVEIDGASTRKRIEYLTQQFLKNENPREFFEYGKRHDLDIIGYQKEDTK